MSQGGIGGKRVLIVDRDTDLCAQVRGDLQTIGLQVKAVADSGIWPDQAQDYRPDLILGDMGALARDDFRPLRTLRTRQETSATPLIALTSAGQESAVIQALKLGADEFLPKPFNRELLVNAVSSRLGAGSLPPIAPVPRESVADAAPAPRALVEEGVRSGDSAVPDNATPGGNDTRHAVVLLCEIVNYTGMVANLDAAERRVLLDEYYNRLREPLLRRAGSVVTFMGESVLAIFEAEEEGRPNHASRAATAALRIIVVAERFREWLRGHYPDRGLPDFAVAVALHIGEVTVCGTAASQDGVVIGPTVDTTARLCRRGRELGWSLCASDQVARAVRVACGRREGMELGRATLEIVEITGLMMEKNSVEMMAELVGNIRKAVSANSGVLERMLQASMKRTDQLSAPVAPRRLNEKPVEIEGFRLIKKIGEGGMSQVFLAENRAGGPILVLKVLELSHDADDMVLRRFVQEFALASNIRHRNVARIYAQGFTESHAYIAMEYLPRGDLRARIAEGLSTEQALAFLVQTARALVAIHHEGIMHCDLKPDNLMLRDDSSLALADFGIAKHNGAVANAHAQAEVLGTPYYMSPEQILGKDIDLRCDLYSLGVIFFEMLTGDKPYHAQTVADLLEMHVRAPLPRLPAQQSAFQHVLDRLMAKDPNSRFPGAADALAAINALAQSTR